MANGKVKILIACGSGVCTSTVAETAVKDILKRNGIDASIDKCSLNEIKGKQAAVDLILTTSNYKKPLDKPCVSVFGLISGINKDKVEENIVEECKKILEK
ncbi:MAG: PTS sugar transporter subunit IIB [Anaerostipes sp.]|nr:PTS sugar transporter subunit IIB [Anaerostipes sp.]